MLPWIDIHTHLNFLDEGPPEAVNRALAQGVERMITIGTCPADHKTVLELAEKFSPYVYCTLGVHPHEAELYNDAVEEFIGEHLHHERVVAVAEIGLDYYYDNSPRQKQEEAFRRQLSLSLEHDLPVQIHTRDAEADTIRILKDFGGEIKGLIHCFTGTQELADECLAMGLNISFSGIITFKNAGDLRAVVQSVPLERLHVETDAPFLTPVPFRGKKNTPAYVVNTAEKVAALKGISLEELQQQTSENAKTIFKKITW